MSFLIHFSLLLSLSTPLFAQEEPLKVADGKSSEIQALKQISRGFTQVAKQTIPAVVSINVQQSLSTGEKNILLDPFTDDIIKRFFGSPFVKPENRAPQKSFGSGTLIDSAGYIVTNHHVIKNGGKIEVMLADESVYPAQVIGSDPDTDLAVLKIDCQNLPHLLFGNSDELEMGEWVIAVGSPHLFRSSLTVGVVSAKGRGDLQLNIIEEFIQSDVAINPGSSGGPLLNIEGEIVGINTAIFSPSGAYSGVSFAIPSNIVKLVSQQIIEFGGVKRGFMGISLQAVTPEIALAYNLDKVSGIVVTDVLPGSAAEKAGLRFADVILAIDGQEIKGTKNLYHALWKKMQGQRVLLTINREGQQTEIPVILEEKLMGQRGSISKEESFGLDLQFSDKEALLLINSVDKGSPSERAHIMAGMKILGINRQRPQSLEEAYSLLKEAYTKGKVLLLVDTGKGSIFIMLEAQ